MPPGYAGVGRQVFPSYLQQGLMAAVYPHHYYELIAQYARALATFDDDAIAVAQRALRDYAAFLDMPAEYFLETLEVVFHRARLGDSTWVIRGEPVQPRDIKDLPLLTVEGGNDRVTGAGQTHAAHALCSGISPALQHRLDVADCDHYCLFTGTHWRGEIHQAIRAVFAG